MNRCRPPSLRLAVAVVGLMLLIATPGMRGPVSIFPLIDEGVSIGLAITVTILILPILSFVLRRAHA